MAYKEKYDQLNSYLTQGHAVLLNVMIPRVHEEKAETITHMLAMDVSHIGVVAAGPKITGHYLCSRIHPAHSEDKVHLRKRVYSVYVYPADF